MSESAESRELRRWQRIERGLLHVPVPLGAAVVVANLVVDLGLGVLVGALGVVLAIGVVGLVAGRRAAALQRASTSVADKSEARAQPRA